jgi:EmrB/QacA subfamily drug resistance transporter
VSRGESPDRPGWILLAVVLGSAVVFLDGTLVNVALRPIGDDLPSSVLGRLEGLTYVTSGYLAVLAALLILAGALGDTYGRRRAFAIGLVGFGVTSVACGLAPSLELLVIARLFQGAAGALLVPGALAIITASFSGEARGRSIGIWAAATSAVTILGPVIGGVLIQAFSWRAAFLVNVPLIAIAAYALRYVPESRDERATGRFDWIGAIVVAIAVGGLAFGAIRGQQAAWSDPVAWGALIVGAIALLAFPFLMTRRQDPLVPVGLFRSRVFSTVNLTTFLVYGALYMTLAYLALYLQGTLGYSPLAAGLASVVTAILLTVLSTPMGRLAGRSGARWFLVLGPLVMAAGLLWLTRIPADSASWPADVADPASLIPPTSFLVDVLPAMLVFGVGLSVLVAPLTTELMGSVPTRNAGLASAINNSISRVGAPLVGAALFIVVNATYYAALGSQVPGLDVSDPEVRAQLQPFAQPSSSVPSDVAMAAQDASTRAFHLSMFVSVSLLAGGAVVSWYGLRPRPGDGERSST